MNILENRRGKVRALLAVWLVGLASGVFSTAGLYLIIARNEYALGLEALGTAGAMATFALGFYFGSRQANGSDDADVPPPPTVES